MKYIKFCHGGWEKIIEVVHCLKYNIPNKIPGPLIYNGLAAGATRRTAHRGCSSGKIMLLIHIHCRDTFPEDLCISDVFSLLTTIKTSYLCEYLSLFQLFT